MKAETFNLISHEVKSNCIHFIHGLPADGKYKVTIEPVNDKRTLTQNSALHLYFTQLAQALNDAGLDMVAVLSEGAKIPWSEHKVKDDIWRKVQKPLTNKESTTELTRKEVSQVYDVINRHISETFGLYVPFPDKFNR